MIVRSRPEPTLSVADQGPGVAQEERALIFERFKRGRETGGEAGFGLGLAIGRELAQRMGGSLVLTDTDGPGATFTLRCSRPRRPPRSAWPAQPASDQPLPPGRYAGFFRITTCGKGALMLALAAIFSVSSGLGYALPAIIGLESMGVPSPGETALVAGGRARQSGPPQHLAGDPDRRLLGDPRGQHRLPAGPQARPRGARQPRAVPRAARARDRDRRPLLQAPRRKDRLHRPLDRLDPLRHGLAGRHQPHAVPRLLPVERRRRDHLGDHLRPARLLRRPGGDQRLGARRDRRRGHAGAGADRRSGLAEGAGAALRLSRGSSGTAQRQQVVQRDHLPENDASFWRRSRAPPS